MSFSARYRPAGSRVIHETFDDEVVIVNLDSGRYYSAQQAGADVWQLIVAGQSVDEMATHLAPHYDAAPETMAAAIARYCEQLSGETLVTPADESSSSAPLPTLADRGRRPFVEPRLQVFTDMQDLLLLDPIHEVGPEGWPVARTDDAGSTS
jgi:hypothetical protein